jgi:hypothetical protein
VFRVHLVYGNACALDQSRSVFVDNGGNGALQTERGQVSLNLAAIVVASQTASACRSSAQSSRPRGEIKILKSNQRRSLRRRVQPASSTARSTTSKPMAEDHCGTPGWRADAPIDVFRIGEFHFVQDGDTAFRSHVLTAPRRSS